MIPKHTNNVIYKQPYSDKGESVNLGSIARNTWFLGTVRSAHHHNVLAARLLYKNNDDVLFGFNDEFTLAFKRHCNAFELEAKNVWSVDINVKMYVGAAHPYSHDEANVVCPGEEETEQGATWYGKFASHFPHQFFIRLGNTKYSVYALDAEDHDTHVFSSTTCWSTEAQYLWAFKATGLNVFIDRKPFEIKSNYSFSYFEEGVDVCNADVAARGWDK